MLYSRARCAKVGYSHDAVNEHLVDRKLSVRLGQFLVWVWYKYIEIQQTAHYKHTKPHTLFPIGTIFIHC